MPLGVKSAKAGTAATGRYLGEYRQGRGELSGKVDSGAERALAIELAQNVRGVKSVQSKALTL